MENNGMLKNAELIERSFKEAISQENPEVLSKWAAEADTYLRTVRRERAFCRKIFEPKVITDSDCIVSKDSDELFYRDEKQPYSGKGMAIAWRGEPEFEYLEGKRYDIVLHPIVSPIFEKKTRELRTWKMPFTSIVEKQGALDIEYIEDDMFVSISTAAATASGQVVNAPAGSDLTPALLSEFFKVFPMKSEYAVDCLLMSDVSYNDWNKNTNVISSASMSDVWSKVVIDGYIENRILGRRVVWSTKTHLIDEYDPTTKALTATRVFAFTDPSMMGKFLMLQDLKMYLNNVMGTVSFYLEEIIGMAIENIYSVAILRIPVAPPAP